MKVLVACEFTGKVRDAFIRKGHDAISCDLDKSESNFGPHIQGDVRNLDLSNYDLIIAHPPCTYLCLSGNRYYGKIWSHTDQKFIEHPRRKEAMEIINFFFDNSINKLALENPRGIINNFYAPTQKIQPYEFGHPENKETYLWLKNLPKLEPTNIVYNKMMKLPVNKRNRIHYMPSYSNRDKLRSITYDGIAKAMAEQWG